MTTTLDDVYEDVLDRPLDHHQRELLVALIGAVHVTADPCARHVLDVLVERWDVEQKRRAPQRLDARRKP